MGKTIVLISSKGGSGKSTVAVGLATALSQNSYKVLLVDADEGARCLDTLLAVGEDTLFDLKDLLSGNAELSQVALDVPALPGVSVIPSPFDPEPLEFDNLSELIADISDNYDYVILDTKGQLPASKVSKLKCADTFIEVVTPDPIAVKNTGVLTSELVGHGIECRLVIDRFETKNAERKINNIDDIIDNCGATLLGVVPEDKRIASHRKPPFIYGTAAAAIYRIAARISGKDIPLPKIKEII